MFNPFYPFTRNLLEAFVQRGKTYFIRQTFQRAMNHADSEIKGCFLFSHYDNLTTAQDHFGAISYDPKRYLYDYSIPEHKVKLHIASSGLKEYRVFASIFRNNWEDLLPVNLPIQIRRYVKTLDWSPKGNDSIDTNFEVQFGELFIRLRYGKREAKVKFEEIEKIC
jgi:hypothetical protein